MKPERTVGIGQDGVGGVGWGEVGREVEVRWGGVERDGAGWGWMR